MTPMDHFQYIQVSPNFPVKMLLESNLRDYLIHLLQLLYADDSNQQLYFEQSKKIEDIQRRVEAYMNVEAEMDKIIKDMNQQNDSADANDVYLSLQEFQDTLACTINWTRYVQSVMPAEVLLKLFPNGLNVAETRISNVQLIKRYEQLIGNLSAQVLSDYMDWKVILSEVQFLDDRYLDAGFQLDFVKRAARWKECKTYAHAVFPGLLERAYIKRFMEINATEAHMQEMLQNLKKSFHEMLDQNDRIDEHTKVEAFKKLHSLNVFMAYTDFIFNDTQLNKLFSDLEIRPGQPFAETMASMSKWAIQKDLLQLLEPDSIDVQFTSLTTEGSHYSLSNSIVLTDGILQGVFFNPSRPLPLNFGGIGFILAHEIMHGLTAHLSQQQKQCFIDQYNAIVVPGVEPLHINGTMTVDENIADNVGIRAAYSAMHKALEADLQAAQWKVRGLEEYSAEQLFFISYAFNWCANKHPLAAFSAAIKDTHSPAEARANVVLGNMPEFSKHFNCPVGSAMHPEKRCQVW